MNTNRATAETVRLSLSTRPICAFFKQYWRAFQEERSRQKLRAALYELNDHDLKDIGISRGMIAGSSACRVVRQKSERSSNDLFISGKDRARNGRRHTGAGALQLEQARRQDRDRRQT